MLSGYAMPEPLGSEELPQATVEHRKRLRVSVVWIIPILAAVIALGIAVQRLMNEGPTVTLTFRAAEGIAAGKSFVKYKDVTVGTVTAVQLSQDYARVVVKAKMEKYAAGLLVEDTQFWVVAPRITLAGVSGLGTLLSGNYIGVQPGKSPHGRRNFIGLDLPPAIPDRPGRQFVLRTSNLGSLMIGAPVYYRNLNVGAVMGYALAADGRTIDIQVFVDAPYDRWVTSSARFWNASGIDVSVGAEGVKVQTESLIAVLAGGVAFDTPEYLRAGAPVPANTAFTLYPNRELALIQPELLERHYAVLFDESVRGLSVGAPVTFLGLTVGNVTAIDLAFNPQTLVFRPRAVFTFYPQRVLGRVTASERARAESMATQSQTARAELLRRMVEEKGLRGELKTGNLLTGELYIAFGYHANAPKPKKIDWNADPLELPVAPGGFGALQEKLGSILTKLDRMPLDTIGDEARDVLATLNTTLKDASTLLGRVNTDLVPESTKTLQDLHRAIANADRALLSKDSGNPQELHQTLQELAEAARSVRVLADYLERHPAALIRGKTEEQP
jgi:paraquat-inducible protein B